MTGRRMILAFAVALVISGALFWLMQGLIHAGDDGRVDPGEAVAMLEPVRVIAERPAPPPPPPERQTTPQRTTPRPQTASLSIAPLAFPKAATTMPDLELEFSLTGRLQSEGMLTGVAGGDAMAAFSSGQQGFKGDDLVPVSSARPRYPRSAAIRGIEGWVEVIFIIDGDGRVRNVRVLDASPRGVFEDATVHAVTRWLYAPFYVNGRKVAREATQLFRFSLDDVQEIYLWDD